MANKKRQKRRFVISGELSWVHVVVFLILCLVFVRETRFTFGGGLINDIPDVGEISSEYLSDYGDFEEGNGIDNHAAAGSDEEENFDDENQIRNSLRGLTNIKTGITYGSGPKYISSNGSEFEMGTITISDGEKYITILDRNLGATSRSTGLAGYGYGFQWGNNFGGYANNIQGQAVNISLYSWNNPYVSGTFYYLANGPISDRYSLPRTNFSISNFWGGKDDNIANNYGEDTSDMGYMRQGPCPAGYHIPSSGEWGALLNLYYSVQGSGSAKLRQFFDVFYLPMVNRQILDDSVSTYADFYVVYTSTPDTAYRMSNNEYHPYFQAMSITSSWLIPVRCFQDYYVDEEGVTLSFETNGGTKMQGQTVLLGHAAHALGGFTPTKDGVILSGWYRDSELIDPFLIGTDVLTGDTTIYAAWKCRTGYRLTDNGETCEIEKYNITWENRDNSVIKTDIVEYNNYPNYLGETPTKPDDECYTYPFRDWFPQIGKAIQDTSYTAQYYQYNRYFDVIYMDGENEIERDQANCGTYWLRDYIEKTGYVFEGWYTDKNYLNSLETESIEIEGDVLLYGKWEACPEGQSVVNNKCANVGITYQDNVTTYIDSQGDEFEMGSITVSNGEDVITLLDRNLGATATGGEEAYGYHFQWGNNYGFDPNKSIKTRTSKVDASDYYRYNPYYSDTFYTNSNSSASARDSSNNNDLWGGINQGEPSIGYRMQGPCPAGYHVPSADEWATLLEIYHDLDDRGSSLDGYYPAYEVENRAFRKGFQDAFYIAYAGFRDNNASLTNQGSVARFWTSTPYDDGEGKQSWRFYLDKNRVDLSGVKMQRLNGYSVRCFLDTDEESVSDTVVLSFDTRGGTKISSKTLHRGDSFDMQLIPAKKDDKFVGWYMDKNLIQSYNGQSLERDTTLYAKYMSDLIVHENYVTTYTDTQGKVFNMGTFTIEADGYSITLLDRNLGATSTNGEDAYGYYFQWGNNYGFSWYNAIQTSNTLVDASGYAWDNPYVDDRFIVGNSNWDNSSNSDLWGDNTDTQAARQGPCPAGYHVPTLDEWEALIDAYAYYSEDSYGSTAFREGFQDTFKIPLAGRMRYRDGSSMSAGEVENEGSHARIWASDDNGDLAGRFYLGGNTVDTNNNSEKAYGYQVRCFKNSDVDTVTLFYEVNGGTPMQAQTLSKGDEGYLPGYETTKKGDELKGWYSDISMTQEFDFNTTLMQDTTIYAKWGLSHVVTFVDRDGSALKTQIVNYGGSAIAPQAPFRGGYVFNGWDLDFSNVTGDMVITAQYTKNQSTSNGGGGGGGGSSLKRDICPDGDYSDSYYDGKCGKKPNEKDDEKDSSADPQNDTGTAENGNNKHNSAYEVVYDTLRFNPHYSDEMNRAYQFAYHYGITTKTNIKDAAMNWELTRIAMAKMLSQYAINVLGIQPDKSRNNQFADVSDNLDTEYDDGVTLAYQLGIMGINMPNNEFKPYNYVTRAEFATALSRLLYHTSDGMFEKTSRYYVPHINKLAYEGILTNTDPTMKELRGYVMLMLMRSAK